MSILPTGSSEPHGWWRIRREVAESTPLTRLTALLKPALEQSKIERRQKIKNAIQIGLINQHEASDLNRFKDQLKNDKKWLKRHLHHSNPLNGADKRTLEEKIQDLKNMCQQELNISEKECTFLFSSFENSGLSLDIDLHLSCCYEQILNFVINRRLFLATRSRFLMNHKENILSQMGIKNSLGISFVYELLSGGDPHNGGQIPLRLTFKWIDSAARENKTLRVYLKPRGAQVECKIIETFRHLNQNKDPDTDFELPDYKIISFEEEGYSIWEEIPGNVGNVTKEFTAGEVVLKWNGNKRHIGGKRLRDLERVCSYLKITDLHPENCIFKDDGSIVLIDLEVINFISKNTMLTTISDRRSARPPFPKDSDCYETSFSLSNEGIVPDDDWPIENYSLETYFNPAQINILNEAKRSLLTSSYRILPTDTKELYTGLESCQSFIQDNQLPAIVNMVADGLSKLSYSSINFD